MVANKRLLLVAFVCDAVHLLHSTLINVVACFRRCVYINTRTAPSLCVKRAVFVFSRFIWLSATHQMMWTMSDEQEALEIATTVTTRKKCVCTRERDYYGNVANGDDDVCNSTTTPNSSSNNSEGEQTICFCCLCKTDVFSSDFLNCNVIQTHTPVVVVSGVKFDKSREPSEKIC